MCEHINKFPISDPSYQALYLHIPFCAARCGYCDFVTEAIAGESDQIDEYLEDLLADIGEASDQGLLGAIQTVYIGGGTPSHLGQKRLTRLLGLLQKTLASSPIQEFTIEANPESLLKLQLDELKELGATRISLGVQSLDDQDLQILARIHDVKTALQAVYQVQASGLDLSIDLICGIPGQSIDSWLDTLQRVGELWLDHLSIYPLTIEKDTPLARFIEKSDNSVFDLELPDQDQQAEDLLLAEDYLSKLGLERYEVSSYARPGHESLHNLAYWTGKPYLGIGRGAVGMAMLKSPDSGNPIRQRFQEGEVVDELTGAQIAAEDLMMRMRLTAGVSEVELREFAECLPGALEVFQGLIKDGLVEKQSKRYRPTQRGWLLGNHIFEEIIGLA